MKLWWSTGNQVILLFSADGFLCNQGGREHPIFFLSKSAGLTGMRKHVLFSCPYKNNEEFSSKLAITRNSTQVLRQIFMFGNNILIF